MNWILLLAVLTVAAVAFSILRYVAWRRARLRAGLWYGLESMWVANPPYGWALDFDGHDDFVVYQDGHGVTIRSKG